MEFLNTLWFAFNAVMPIILLILLGYFLRKKNFLSDDFLRVGNKFAFKLCMPALLFINIYSIGSFSEIKWDVVIFSEIIIISAFLIGLLFVKLFVKDDRKKGVVLQCIFRSNFAIIGIPLSESLGGAGALEIVAILSAFTIPTFNILAVTSLSIFVKDGESKPSFRKILLNICKNPLIIGVVLGLVCLGIRALIPTNSSGELYFSLKGSLPFLYKAIENLSKICSPLALIILGGMFDFSAVKGMLKEIIYGTAGRLVVVPGVAILLGVLLSKYTNLINFDSSVYPALVALFGSPVAVSSAIMAESMNNDGELGGQLVVWTSVFSILTIFIFVVILRSLALI